MNKKVQYGLMLCHYLAVHGQTSIAKVADELAIPYEFLEQIAIQLRKAVVIRSKRGPGGGYTLVEGTTLFGVLDALDWHPGAITVGSDNQTDSFMFLDWVSHSMDNCLRPFLIKNFKLLVLTGAFDRCPANFVHLGGVYS